MIKNKYQKIRNILKDITSNIWNLACGISIIYKQCSYSFIQTILLYGAINVVRVDSNGTLCFTYTHTPIKFFHNIF